MNEFSIIASMRSQHQNGHANALAAGLAKHGIASRIFPSRYQAISKQNACWGWRTGRHLRALGHNVLVMERGYLGDRFAWTSLGWNGLNNHAQFARKDDPSRFEKYFADLLKPWREGGDYVLLIGQVPGDMSLSGRSLQGWYVDAAKQARTRYSLPVRFREHPVCLKKGIRRIPIGTQESTSTLDDDLAGAAAVVTWNSNTAVESVLAGVPTVVIDRGSMAWDMAGHVIGERVTPDRIAWAHRLAWCQWSIEEIESGEAWSVVGGLVRG